MQPDLNGRRLANSGNDYLVYLHKGNELTMDFSAASGIIAAQWLRPVEQTIHGGEPVEVGAEKVLQSPLGGDAVLHLKARAALKERR
jgi:phenolic acid decarboxylase